MTLTEKDITADVARSLRLKAGLSQKQFWQPLGVAQSVGCRYEAAGMPIPKPVRILIVATYVAGVKIDAATPEGVTDLGTLGDAQATRRTVKKSAAQAAKALTSAIETLTTITKT